METHTNPSGCLATLRHPRLEDGDRVHSFVHQCGTLEPNTSYCYFLLCSHFAKSCAVAEMEGKIVGFVGAYLLPERPDTLFVWQVGVAEEARGQGLSGKMIRYALAAQPGVCWLEATVSPGNVPSEALFAGIARRLGVEHITEPFLEPHHFRQQAHEPEVLHRIGPFASLNKHQGETP